MRHERRKTERRVDPNAWTPEHKKKVLFLYGLAVGGVLILGGLVVIVWAVTNQTVNNVNAALGAGLVVVGVVASMPSTFLPFFSSVLKKIPWGRVSDQRGAITRAMPTLPENGDSEE